MFTFYLMCLPAGRGHASLGKAEVKIRIIRNGGGDEIKEKYTIGVVIEGNLIWFYWYVLVLPSSFDFTT